MRLNSFYLSPLSSAGCSGFADRLVTFPQLLRFPAKGGLERALLREAVYLMTVYQQCLEYTISLPTFTSSHVRLPSLSPRLSCPSRTADICRILLSTTRVRLLLVHLYGCDVDNESSTRCHTQAVPLLIALRAAVSKDLPSTQQRTLDEQSADAAVRELEYIRRG